MKKQILITIVLIVLFVGFGFAQEVKIDSVGIMIRIAEQQQLEKKMTAQVIRHEQQFINSQVDLQKVTYSIELLQDMLVPREPDPEPEAEEKD